MLKYAEISLFHLTHAFMLLNQAYKTLTMQFGIPRSIRQDNRKYLLTRSNALEASNAHIYTLLCLSVKYFVTELNIYVALLQPPCLGKPKLIRVII